MTIVQITTFHINNWPTYSSRTFNFRFMARLYAWLMELNLDPTRRVTARIVPADEEIEEMLR